MYASTGLSWLAVPVWPSAGSQRHICSGCFYPAYLKTEKIDLGTFKWVCNEWSLEKSPQTPSILRIYLERWMGKWRMKSRYLLSPEDRSLKVSRSTNRSEGALLALGHSAFPENSLFISGTHWRGGFHCPSRTKPEKDSWLGCLRQPQPSKTHQGLPTGYWVCVYSSAKLKVEPPSPPNQTYKSFSAFPAQGAVYSLKACPAWVKWHGFWNFL